MGLLFVGMYVKYISHLRIISLADLADFARP